MTLTLGNTSRREKINKRVLSFKRRTILNIRLLSPEGGSTEQEGGEEGIREMYFNLPGH